MTIWSEEYSRERSPIGGIVSERRCKVVGLDMLPFLSAHATLYTYETNITIINLIHHFPTGSAVICCAGWQDEARMRRWQFWKGMSVWCKKKKWWYSVIVPVQEVYLQQVWLILCPAATHLSIDGKSCNPWLLWFSQRRWNPGYFNRACFSVEDTDTLKRLPH